jgi:VanZ family protein
VIRKNINIYWLLSLLYMGLIFYLSSYPEPTEVPSLPYFDKAAHVVEYGILASLIYLALRDLKVSSRYLLAVAFAIAFMYGVSDEIHQYFVPSRDADVLDVVADGIGALCFLFPLRYYDHRSKDRKRRPGNGEVGRLETEQKF